MKTTLVVKIIQQVDEQTAQSFLQHYLGETLKRVKREESICTYAVNTENKEIIIKFTKDSDYINHLKMFEKEAYDNWLQDICHETGVITHVFAYKDDEQRSKIEKLHIEMTNRH